MTPPRKEYNNRSEFLGEETLIWIYWYDIVTKSMVSDLTKGLSQTLLIFQLWLLNIITPLMTDIQVSMCITYFLTYIAYFYSSLSSALDKMRGREKEEPPWKINPSNIRNTKNVSWIMLTEGKPPRFIRCIISGLKRIFTSSRSWNITTDPNR